MVAQFGGARLQTETARADARPTGDCKLYHHWTRNSVFVLLLALMLQPDVGAADITVNITMRRGALKKAGLVVTGRPPLPFK